MQRELEHFAEQHVVQLEHFAGLAVGLLYLQEGFLEFPQQNELYAEPQVPLE